MTFTTNGQNKTEFFCKGLATLLRGVSNNGSLMASTKAIGMAYSKGMRLLRDAEAGLGVDLLESYAGVGSKLTPVAVALLETYEQIEKETSEIAEEIFNQRLNEINKLR